MSFCLEDGTPLEAHDDPTDQAATIKIPPARLTNQAPTEVMPGLIPGPTQVSPTPSPLQHVPHAAATPAGRKKSALPWIGAALILGLSAIAVALIMTRGSGTDSAQIAQNTPAQLEGTPGNSSIPTEPNSASTKEGSEDTIQSSPSTPGSETSTKSQTGGTPEQPSTTPRPGSTSRPTPLPKPSLTPTPEPPRPRSPISGGVLNGRAISKPAPPYPPLARAARASGTVTVQITVDEKGRVTSASAVSGHPLLRQSAVQAAYGARFSPTLLSGQPVKVSGVLTYNFTLQ